MVGWANLMLRLLCRLLLLGDGALLCIPPSSPWRIVIYHFRLASRRRRRQIVSSIELRLRRFCLSLPCRGLQCCDMVRHWAKRGSVRMLVVEDASRRLTWTSVANVLIWASRHGKACDRALRSSSSGSLKKSMVLRYARNDSFTSV